MNDDKLNNELDDFFRTELENLPEEKPSAADWEQMNKRIYSEGLLKSNSNGRKFLFLFLLFLFLSGLVSLPFLMGDKTDNGGEVRSSTVNRREVTKPLGRAGEENAPAQSPVTEAGGTGTAQEAALNSAGNTANTPVDLQYDSENNLRKNDFGRNVSPQGTEPVADNNMQPDKKGLKQQTGAATASSAGNNSQNKNDLENQNASEPGINTVSSQAGAGDEKNISEVTAPGTSGTTLQELPPSAQNDSTALKTEDKPEQEGSTKFRRFRLGLYVSADYNYYSLRENSNVTQAEIDFINRSESITGEKFAGQYTIGIMGGYLFSQKFSLEAGAFYSQKKKLHANIYTPAYVSNSGEEMFSDFNYDYKARYFELYGRAKYYLSLKRNPLYITLGAAGGYNIPSNKDSCDYFSRTTYVSGSSVENPSTENERITLDASSMSLAFVISAGMEIPLGKNWDVYVEPAYRYAVTPMVQHPVYDRVPVEHFLRCISLATGLMYKF